MYRKKTAIGRYYNSFTPFSCKIGLKKCLIDRVFKISSSHIIFRNEISKINIILQRNITTFVIDNQIKKFFEIQYTTKINENTINNNKKVYFKLPYFYCILPIYRRYSVYIPTFSNATKI